MSRRASYVLFDLDGVLVDNVVYEQAVTLQIIKQIGKRKQISMERARSEWSQTLVDHRDDPRWHDYGFHCAALGVPDIWQAAHEQSKHLLHAMPRAMESVKAAKNFGNCWVVSDATEWVVRLKLNAAGFEPSVFQEVFTLDRCHAGKGDRKYWVILKEFLEPLDAYLVYVDNRLDRLIAAAEVLPNCRFVHLDSEDHPLSLHLFHEPEVPKHLQIDRVSSNSLPEMICRLSRK